MRSFIPLLAILAVFPGSISASPVASNPTTQPSQSFAQIPAPYELFRAALITGDKSPHIRQAMYDWKEEGYDLDLKEMRLVRFGEDEEPVWMTELEKIEAKAKGLRFMDM